MTASKLIKPDLVGTVKFLACMLDEKEASELIEWLCESYFELKEHYNTDYRSGFWYLLSDVGFILGCINENEALAYNKSPFLDKFIEEYVDEMDNWSPKKVGDFDYSQNDTDPLSSCIDTSDTKHEWLDNFGDYLHALVNWKKKEKGDITQLAKLPKWWD